MREIIVHKEHCVLCGICEMVCPAGVIEVHSSPMVGDTSRCIEGCTECEDNCPTMAIEIQGD